MKGWHFCAADRRLRYGDERLIEAGKTLSVEGKPELCAHGLHASKKAANALRYGAGLHVGYVELRGDQIVMDSDKACANERFTYWIVDATKTILAWTRWCASRHLDKWDAPEIVRHFLKTGENAAEAAGAAWAAAEVAWAARAAGVAAGAAEVAWAARAAGVAVWAAESAARAAVYARVAARAAEAAEAAAEAAEAAAQAAEAAAEAAEYDICNAELEKRLMELGRTQERNDSTS